MGGNDFTSMSSRSITNVIWVLATASALLGISMLYSVFTHDFSRSIAGRDTLGVVYCLFDTLLGGYFTFVGLLVWIRLSPQAVRQLLTILALVLLWSISGKFHWAPHVSPYHFLGTAASCYLFYKLAFLYCRRQLFQDEEEAGVA